MSMVFKKAYTMPLPDGANIVERDDGTKVATWRLRSGKRRSAEVVVGRNGSTRVRGRSPYYTARYNDADGRMVETSTGCKDETAARAVLSKLERRVELVKAGVMTEGESDAADHGKERIDTHVVAYIRHLQAKGCAPRRVSGVRSRLNRVFTACKFTRLAKLDASKLETWLVERADEHMAAATRNSYREACVCFANWCRRTGRLAVNPFVDVPKANVKVDRRHERRALTEDELNALLKVARLRPLAEYGRKTVKGECEKPANTRSRRTWKKEELTVDNIDAAVERAREALRDNEEFADDLELRGRERALIYRTLVLTGLRKGELASLTVAHLELDGPVAYAVLDARDEKNRKGSEISLRRDLVGDIRGWLDDMLERVQREAIEESRPIPTKLPPHTPLFDVPSGLSRIINRDLKAAGIPKRDARNRVVDVHALRHTFGTHLCAAGVPLRIAQAAMRHSKPELTANVYTDPALLDVNGAINALPRFSA